MRRVLAQGLIVVGAVALAYAGFAAQSNPCAQPVEYAIGSIDGRFGISVADITRTASISESLWEQSLQRNLFRYNPDASLKINLVFDQRQQNTQDEKSKRADITQTASLYGAMVGDHSTLARKYTTQVNAYEKLAITYQKRSDSYAQAVTYWNSHGGAPEAEFNTLEQEKLALANMYAEIEKQRKILNSFAIRVNTLGTNIQNLVQKHNSEISTYNSRFGKPQRFEQGDYIPGMITVYQFRDTSDLKLVLAHELGHALGLEHTNEPSAMMYYLMEQQDRIHPAITQADKDAVSALCHLK